MDRPYQAACLLRESRAKGIGDKKQADPLEKEGIVGVFNNAYFPINLAMEKFLSDIYELSADGTRYRFKESSSQPGVEIKEGGKFVYSHHAKDPAYLKLCSAFDIVRIHLFAMRTRRSRSVRWQILPAGTRRSKC